MYEIRKYADLYRIYDKTNRIYIGYTKDENAANYFIYTILKKKGFEGNIPRFLFVHLSYGINIDNLWALKD